MTIGTDTTATTINSKKRSIEGIDPPISRKKQKTGTDQSKEIGGDQPTQKSLPFQKVFHEIIEKCCNPQIELAQRKSAFFVLFLENLQSSHYLHSVLHIIFYHPEHWCVLADCVIYAEEYEGQREQLFKLIAGQYDEDYLRTVGKFSELQMKSLETQRLRVLGHIIGKLLKQLPQEYEKSVDLRTFQGVSETQYPTIFLFGMWFALFDHIQQSGVAVSTLITEYRQVLDDHILIKKGCLTSIPRNIRCEKWRILEKLIITLTNFPMGREYLLSLIERYVSHSDIFETKLFFHFLYTQRSSLRNCINSSLTTKPWFRDLIRKWVPQTLQLFPEARIQAPDIQYNTPWKKNVRSIMQPRSMKGLSTAAQKEILSWSLHFAADISEFWYYLAKNKCLCGYLSKLDRESIKSDTDLQVDLFQSLILARSLSGETIPDLYQQINDFTHHFPHLREHYLPDLMFSLCQDTVVDKRSVPSYYPGMAFPLSKEHLKYLVEREYRLRDSFFQVLAPYQFAEGYPNAVQDLLKTWSQYDFEQKVTFVVNLATKCLEYSKQTKEVHHFFLMFIGGLSERDELDFFVQTLWDEGLLDEEFASTYMSWKTVMQFPVVLHHLHQAILRNDDNDEIFESLNLNYITITLDS